MYSISDSEKDFINLAKEVYQNDPFYMVKNEDLVKTTKLLTVKNGSELVSRCALIENEGLKYENLKTLQIGFFESKNDKKAVEFLFNEVKNYAKNNGFEYILGPINGSTWKKYRITLESSNPPFLLDNYNKPYYSELFSQGGFEVIANYYSSISKNLNKDYSRLNKFSEIYSKKGIKIREFDPNNFEKDIKNIYNISINSFQNNFLYTPIEFSEFYKMYEPAKAFLNPKWVLLAQNSENEPIAFVFAFDNLFCKDKKSLVIKTLAQINDYKYRGIGSFLVEYLHKKAHNEGYDNIIHALMYESNVSKNILFDEVYHKYCLYGVKL